MPIQTASEPALGIIIIIIIINVARIDEVQVRIKHLLGADEIL